MAYQPSPRPQYEGPTAIRYENVVRHLWGDYDAGRVADWIYLSNQNIHALVYALPPGGSYTHSEAYRTIFGADEVMIILEGHFALANPQTGEVQPGGQGEAIFFRKDTWHHGFNLGKEMVRVLEFFAPPPLQGTSGAYAWSRPYLPREAWLYKSEEALRDFPFSVGQSARTLFKIGENDLAWELRGDDRKVLVGHMASTEHIDAGRIYLPPGSQTQGERHTGDEFVYVESGQAFIHLPDFPGERWFELNEKDGFYIPTGIDHEYHNPTGQPGRALFAVAPNA